MRGANIRGFSLNEKANYSIFLLLNASNTNILKKNEFGKLLVEWYNDHKRDLPWRKTRDPYKIWLSEIILQQTRVNQGLPYYQKFISNYPNVKLLADVEEDKLMKDWEGLGYYSRARNLQAAAKQIVSENLGRFPSTYDDILKLKGVGEYTAAAIASFAFNEAKAVLDGNVFRVLSRFFGIDTPINTTKGKKEFTQLAREMLFIDDPANYNQAIMEFGALQCTPKKTDCNICPLQSQCAAYSGKKVDVLPVKEKKNYNRQRYFHFLMMEHNGKILLQKRDGKDIWNKLFQFPLIEQSEVLDFNELLDSGELDGFLNKTELELINTHDLKSHKLSHQTIHCRIFNLKATRSLNEETYLWYKYEEMATLAFPKPLRHFLDRKQLTLRLA